MTSLASRFRNSSFALVVNAAQLASDPEDIAEFCAVGSYLCSIQLRTPSGRRSGNRIWVSCNSYVTRKHN